jgi:hypothetical protein
MPGIVGFIIGQGVGQVEGEANAKRDFEKKQNDQLATILLDASKPQPGNFDVRKETDQVYKELDSLFPATGELKNDFESGRQKLASKFSEMSEIEFVAVIKQMAEDHPPTPKVKYPHLNVSGSLNNLGANDKVDINLGKDSNGGYAYQGLHFEIKHWNSDTETAALRSTICKEKNAQTPDERAKFNFLTSRQLQGLMPRQAATILSKIDLDCSKE